MPDYTIQTLCLQSMVRVSGPVPFVSGRCVICCCRACVVVYASQTVCSIPSLVSAVVNTCHVVGAFGPKLDGVVFGEE